MKSTPSDTAPPPSAADSSSLARAGLLAYGVLAYAAGMGGLGWLIAACLGLVPFTGGVVTLDSTNAAIAFNLALVLLLGVQHAVMARRTFKERWTRVIPAAAERSTYVLLTGVIVAAMMFLWQPLPASIWTVATPALATALRAVAVAGWLYLVGASFAIDHFELFGLRQVWRNYRHSEAQRLPFVERAMYRFDRHPIMTGMLVGLWVTPTMRLDQLVLAAGLTAYMIVGVAIEERTLVQLHGEGYRDYRRRVGALFPLPGRRA